MSRNEWYKANDYKIILKDYLWKLDHNSWHLNPENLPPKIDIGKRPDYSGQEHNYVKLLYPCGYNADGRIMYVCLCKCGNYFLASGKGVICGNTKSCNCLHRNTLVQRNIDSGKDIIGTWQGLLHIDSVAGFCDTVNPGHKKLLVNCTCICGRKCIKQATYIRQGDTKSCGVCSWHSIGEKLIADYLDNHNIKYHHEYSFPDLLNKETLCHFRFDFAILNNDDSIKFLIEFDGEQHYNPNKTGFFKDTYNEIHRRDVEKDNYCKEHNIKLFRIRYDEDLNKRLEEIFDGI